MTSGPALPCPRCQRVLGPESWSDAESGACVRCKTNFTCTCFPALTAAPVPIAAQAALLEADSVCFFHTENRAEAICEGCGRLLCPVCTVALAGRKLCPACIASSNATAAPAVVRERVLFDGIALALAGLPLLIFPFTVVTAPVALGMTIYAWKQPGSLMRGSSRARLILAGVLSLLEIGGWMVALAAWLGRR